MTTQVQSAMPRTRRKGGWRALLVASALMLAPVAAVVGEAEQASAATNYVQVTYCYTAGGRVLSAGHWVAAQYFSANNTWVTVPNVWFQTNSNGCISAQVTAGGQTWRFPVYAYDRYGTARWFNSAGDHVSSGGYLGTLPIW